MTDQSASTPSSPAASDTDTRGFAERYLAAVGAYHSAPSDVTKATVAALFSEDCDWCIPGDLERVPWIGARRGREAVAAFFEELRLYNEPERFEVRDILTGPGRAIVLGDLATRVKATGRLIETDFALDIGVRQGLIVRYRMFEDTFAVARAVG